MANRRINWSGVFGSIFNQFTFAAGILLLGLYSIISSDIESDRHDEENAELIDNLTGENPEDQRYVLESHSIILVNETINGQRMMTAYNFRENYVAIDGPDDADRVLLFSEYPAETIESVRGDKCDIYRSLFSALEDFQTVNGFQHPQFDDLTVNSIPFTNAYCP